MSTIDYKTNKEPLPPPSDDENGDEEEEEEDDDDHGEEDYDEDKERIPTPCPNWKGSVVEYFGPSSSFCGYCKRRDYRETGGRRSYDMLSFRLTASDYQKLIDRGWRRSGTHCYNPINRMTCCPNYSISCKTTKFNLSWSQRKCIENVNSYLITGDIKQKVKLNYASKDGVNCGLVAGLKEPKQKLHSKTYEQLKTSSKAKHRRFISSCERKTKLHNITMDEAMEQIRQKWNKKRPAQLELENYLYPKVDSSIASSHDDKSLFKPKHNLRIKMFHVRSQACKQTRKEEHALMVRYQKAVHKEGRREWSMSRYCDFLVMTPLITELMKDYDYIPKESSTSDTTNLETDDTFSNDIYQDQDSQFLLVKPAELPLAFGTYHSHYYLDEKLIAVGVIDVLPKCLTTVYFFYDPDYSFLNLGIYSGLHEISMVRQMANHYAGPKPADENDQLIHYYLGFYVHECKKMHYKTTFKPSYLQCSKTFKYVSTEICLSKLANQKYARFAEDDGQSSQEVLDCAERLLEIPVTCSVTTSNNVLNYIIWIKTRLGNECMELLVNNYLTPYAQLVGRDLLSKLCLQVNAVHKTLTNTYRRRTTENPTTSNTTAPKSM